jgi:hypothetical protein
MTPAHEHPILFHGGALGDLALTIQLALMLEPRPRELTVVSRIDPGDLSAFAPPVYRRSQDGLSAHWLYGPRDAAPPPALQSLVAGRFVMHALGAPDSGVHRAFAALEPAGLFGLDPRPGAASDRHITAQWRADLEAQGLQFIDAASARPWLESPAQRCADLPEHAGRPILIAPGSGNPAKCWPLGSFLKLGGLLQEAGVPVRFLLGPVEMERWTQDDRDAVARRFTAVAAPPPDELVQMLLSSRVLIGNDAGTSHLAALLGVSTVILFGETRAVQWRPLSRRGWTVQGDPRGDDGTWGLDVEALASSIIERLR